MLQFVWRVTWKEWKRTKSRVKRCSVGGCDDGFSLCFSRAVLPLRLPACLVRRSRALVQAQAPARRPAQSVGRSHRACARERTRTRALMLLWTLRASRFQMSCAIETSMVFVRANAAVTIATTPTQRLHRDCRLDALPPTTTATAPPTTRRELRKTRLIAGAARTCAVPITSPGAIRRAACVLALRSRFHTAPQPCGAWPARSRCQVSTAAPAGSTAQARALVRAGANYS